MADPQMQRAGFGLRLAAAAIDAGLLVVLLALGLALASAVVALLPPSTPEEASDKAQQFLIASTTWLFLLALAYTATEVLGRATPGKRMLKLRVEAAGGGGRDRWRRLLRWALKWSPVTATLLVRPGGFAITYFFDPGDHPAAEGVFRALHWIQSAAMLWGLALLAGLLLALGPRRQALHDLIAGTAVFRPGEAPPGFAPILSQPVVAAPQPSAPDDAPGAP